MTTPAATDVTKSDDVLKLSMKEKLMAISSRHCSRSFDGTRSVPRHIVEAVLEAASNAPSSQNGQPWQVTVLTGEPLRELSRLLCAADENNTPVSPDYANRIRDVDQPADVKKRLEEHGKSYHESQKIARDDLVARGQSRRRNFEFFDATMHLIFHLPAKAVTGTYLDMGCFLQNVLLGLHMVGLGAVPQFSVASHSSIVRTFLKMGSSRHIVCGCSVGYRTDDRVNQYSPSRAPLSEFATFYDDHRYESGASGWIESSHTHVSVMVSNPPLPPSIAIAASSSSSASIPVSAASTPASAGATSTSSTPSAPLPKTA